jgi:hypothetical protein
MEVHYHTAVRALAGRTLFGFLAEPRSYRLSFLTATIFRIAVVLATTPSAVSALPTPLVERWELQTPERELEKSFTRIAVAKPPEGADIAQPAERCDTKLRAIFSETRSDSLTQGSSRP